MRKLPLLLAIFGLSVCSSAQSTGPSTSTTNRTRQSTTSPSRYMLPSGSKIDVRINESLSSETAQQGDRFTGSIENDVVDPSSGRTLIPRNATVSGRVLAATPSGRLSNSGELQLSINTIRVGPSVINVTVEPFVDQGESHTKSNTTKVGGGAALGAIIGAIAGGGKGAAIGAGVGGAAGAGAAAATGKRPAEIKPEALLSFVTATATQIPDAVAQGIARPASTSTSSTQSQSSSTQQSTSDTSTSSEPFPSSSTDDNPPVLQRREGGAASAPSSSPVPSASSSSTQSPSTTNSPGSYGSPTTPSTPTSNTSGSTTSSESSAGNVGTGQTHDVGVGRPAATYPPPTSGNASNASSQLLLGRSFSARDRRVINNCVREHSSTLPDVALHRSASSRTFAKNDTIPVDTNRLLRALPLQCDSQLPVLSNDLERVIYGGQVMLIDSSDRVLDVFALTP